jgi:futalosine hydrolase
MPLRSIDLPLLEKEDGNKVFNIINLSDNHIPSDVLRGVFASVEFCSGSRQRAGIIKNRFKIGEHRLLCEDMESAAVGLIALRADMPCFVLRGISNLCGERDHAKWKIKEAAHAAQVQLIECL